MRRVCRPIRTSLLIGAVRTVQVSVATPSGGDAVVLRTVEFRIWCACGFGAVFLVGTITTVVVPVAHPPLLDTLAVGAGELVRATGLVAVLLVGAVRAVELSVAHPSFRDAHAR